MNLFGIFKGDRHGFPEADDVIEVINKDEVILAPAVLAAQMILYEMVQKNITTETIRRSQPFPLWLKQDVIISHMDPDFSADFDHILNHLKLMSSLNPWAYKEPQQGTTELRIHGRPYKCQMLFDDMADDPFVTLTMSLES